MKVPNQIRECTEPDRCRLWASPASWPIRRHVWCSACGQACKRRAPDSPLEMIPPQEAIEFACDWEPDDAIPLIRVPHHSPSQLFQALGRPDQ